MIDSAGSDAGVTAARARLHVQAKEQVIFLGV
jgi:hypothetical protein